MRSSDSASSPSGGSATDCSGASAGLAVVPVVRMIHTAVRQISGSFTSGETSFDSLVLVEVPRMGVYAVGLVSYP
ncbi:hypothetical protein BRC62_07160 [Halobacteriales archaeon QH_10_67_13]|nr:MAG: hypothetical protein BRC62_07160 [Halobacteriales archaeon QH_10_67_13]